MLPRPALLLLTTPQRAPHPQAHTDLRASPGTPLLSTQHGRAAGPRALEAGVVEYSQDGGVLFTTGETSCPAVATLLGAEKAAGTYLPGLGPAGARAAGAGRRGAALVRGGRGPRGKTALAPRALVMIDTSSGRRYKASGRARGAQGTSQGVAACRGGRAGVDAAAGTATTPLVACAPDPACAGCLLPATCLPSAPPCLALSPCRQCRWKACPSRCTLRGSTWWQLWRSWGPATQTASTAPLWCWTLAARALGQHRQRRRRERRPAARRTRSSSSRRSSGGAGGPSSRAAARRAGRASAPLPRLRVARKARRHGEQKAPRASLRPSPAVAAEGAQGGNSQRQQSRMRRVRHASGDGGELHVSTVPCTNTFPIVQLSNAFNDLRTTSEPRKNAQVHWSEGEAGPPPEGSEAEDPGIVWCNLDAKQSRMAQYLCALSGARQRCGVKANVC